MDLGIFAKTFPRPNLDDTLDAIVAQGLTHVQFNMSCVGLPTLPARLDEDHSLSSGATGATWTLPARLDEDHCRWIARAFRERDLTMAAISGTFNLCDPDGSRLQENLHRLENLARACRWLDTRIITLCTGTRDPEDMWRWHAGNVRKRSWDTLIQALREAVKIAERHEVILAFEPELNNVVNSVSKARRLLDEIASTRLKVVIDPANLLRPEDFLRLPEILEEAFDWLGSDIVLAHAKEPRDHAIVDPDALEFYQKALSGEVGSGLSSMVIPGRSADILSQMGQEMLRMLLRLQSHLRCQAFFTPYIVGLKRIRYEGAVIIHGIEEDQVRDQVQWLRSLLSIAGAAYRKYSDILES